MTREHETSTIDRLFLELSHFSKAKTGYELQLEKEVGELNKIIAGFKKVPLAFHDVAAERVRQMKDEGWTAEHDDEVNSDGSLAWASACYAVATGPVNPAAAVVSQDQLPHALWPWALHCYKPKDRRRDLVRAAALLIAEIERLDRAAKKRGAA